MEGWQCYITEMISPDHSGACPIEEAAICGIEPGEESVWATTPDSAGIGLEEIRKLVAPDRPFIHMNGIEIFGLKYLMLREWFDREVFVIDMKTKPNEAGEMFSVCVAKTKKTLIIGRGNKKALGSQVSGRVLEIAQTVKEYNL